MASRICLAFGVSGANVGAHSHTEVYEEAVRRGFLMTGGGRFVSVKRAQMAKARADQAKIVGGGDVDPKKPYVHS